MTFVNKILSNITKPNYKFDNSVYREWCAAHTVTKGAVGEKIAWAALEDKGFNVSKRVAKTHDMVVNGKKTEVKTAFEQRDLNRFIVYGFDATSDASYWLVQLVRPESITAYRLDRVNWSTLQIDKSGGGGTLTVFTEEEMIASGAEVLYKLDA